MLLCLLICVQMEVIMLLCCFIGIVSVVSALQVKIHYSSVGGDTEVAITVSGKKDHF